MRRVSQHKASTSTFDGLLKGVSTFESQSFDIESLPIDEWLTFTEPTTALSSNPPGLPLSQHHVTHSSLLDGLDSSEFILAVPFGACEGYV
jgi:hypothetical protein